MRKRLIYLLVISLMLLMLAACGGTTQPGDTSEPEAEPPAAEEASESTEPETEEEEPVEEEMAEEEPAAEEPAEEAEAEGEKKTLTWSFTQGVVCLDPPFQTGGTDSMILVNVYNSLVTHNPESLKVVDPDLAESWEVSEDGTVYTFNLREGVQWQNGYGELTADDVVWTWERIMDPDTGARGANVLAPVASIEAVDDYTVQVTLESPYSPFLVNIAHSPATLIVNQQAVEELGEEYCLNPVGTGPYIVTEAESNGDAVMEAFDDHFKGRPAIDELVLRAIPEESVAALALRDGEIDYMIVREPANILSLQNDDSIVVNADENFAASMYALWLNNTREPFTDPRVRQALIHAIDRETLVREATEGFLSTVAHSVVPPSLLGHTQDVTQYEFDQDRARELLAEAGYGDGADLTALTIGAQAMQTAFNPIMLTIVQQMWAEVGVNLEIEYLERGAIRERQGAGDYDITVSNPTRAEVDLLLDFFRCENFPPGPNFALYEGPCDLINEQATIIDQDERAEAIQEIQRQIADDAPIVPLWYPVEVTAARPNVSGLIPNLGGWQTRFYLFDIAE